VSSFDELPEADKIERYERFARKALMPYGLEDADLRCLDQSSNVMFRVQADDSRWALRICNPGRDHQILRRELLWLVALCRDTDMVVPEPVIMRSGDLFRSVSMPGVPGFRACMLFRWVKGQFEKDPTAQHLEAIGILTAKLHKHAETFRWPEELEPRCVSPETVGDSIPTALLTTHYTQSEAETIRDTLPFIQRAMTSLGTGASACGAIHGDLHHRNIPFHDGVARAIDFECVQRNYYAYDMATTFSALSGRPDLDELMSAYVDGYSSIRPLPCDLDEHLPSFDMLRAFTMVAWILGTPRLRTDEWALGILKSAVRKARSLLESQ
jgi:Ser/Thr protein kinase RdoA (MazF antagonist)